MYMLHQTIVITFTLHVHQYAIISVPSLLLFQFSKKAVTIKTLRALSMFLEKSIILSYNGTKKRKANIP